MRTLKVEAEALVTLLTYPKSQAQTLRSKAKPLAMDYVQSHSYSS